MQYVYLIQYLALSKIRNSEIQEFYDPSEWVFKNESNYKSQNLINDYKQNLKLVGIIKYDIISTDIAVA